MVDLSPAEQAAVEVPFDLWGSKYPTVGDVLSEPTVRALVAAVRPLLYREAAARMLSHAQEAEDHDATEGAVYTFMVAADRIRGWAAELEQEARDA